MGREQMRNLDTSRIGGAQVNEFEYQKNQGELTEQLEQHSGAGKESRRLTQAERVKQIMEAAHKKVQKKKKKKEAATVGRKESTTKSAAKSTKKAGKSAKKK
ncbi:MAG TPA: hypothetical protein VFD48_04290 [Pyrinomonadaceae bacterium]|nr:hypothetical protein [Pyrinomonadaceae bacterium]